MSGEDSGPSKLEKAAKLGTKILTEDGLLELIATSKGKTLKDTTPAPAKKSKKAILEFTEPASAPITKSVSTPFPPKRSEVIDVDDMEVCSDPIIAKQDSSVKAKKTMQSLNITSKVAVKPVAKQLAAAINHDAQSLWTVKYKPKAYNEIIGNKSNVDRLALWLKNWDKYRTAGFAKDGKDELADKKAILIR